MKHVTFEQSINLSSTEFYLLRERAENKTIFDQAVQWMISNKFKCNVELGTVHNKQGFVSSFSAYDWADDYKEQPSLIFYDFFRGCLLNKYIKLIKHIS